MNVSMMLRERQADAETKAGPDTTSQKLPALPLSLRQWNRKTGRDISLPMTWCGTSAAGPMCARLYGGMSLEKRSHSAGVFSPGALYSLLDRGGQSPYLGGSSYMIRNDRKCPKSRASKNTEKTILCLVKNQAVCETRKEFLCKEFWPFFWSRWVESAALGRCGCRRARGRQDQWGRHARSLPGCCYWG